MTLRGINFGPVLNASGAQGFFGEGYPFHDKLRQLGLTFDRMTFVAKTTTLYPRQGNMPLEEDGLTPKESRPKCVVVRPLQGVVLNSVGLSGCGVDWLLKQNRWQQRTDPFFLSFMAVEHEPAKKLEETQIFSERLASYRCSFKTKFGLQVNVSCPNVKAVYSDIVRETGQALLTAGIIGVPLVPKINALLPPQDACRIAEFDLCDAICVSNTIPFGELPHRIRWKLHFPFGSPLVKRGFGGGGLSGNPLFPIVRDWIKEARDLGLTKPIIAEGGILSPKQAIAMLDAGANAVSLGTIAILRPWRMAKTIQAAYNWSDWDRE